MINLTHIKEFFLSFLTGLLVMSIITLALGLISPTQLFM